MSGFETMYKHLSMFFITRVVISLERPCLCKWPPCMHSLHVGLERSACENFVQSSCTGCKAEEPLQRFLGAGRARAEPVVAGRILVSSCLRVCKA